MYLFDTDTITNIFKKKPSEKLIKKLSRVKRAHQFISSITIGEICYGAFKSPDPQHHLNQMTDMLLPRLYVLAFDTRAAFYYGKTRAELEKLGSPVSAIDLQIASIALANDMILVTDNIKHFLKIKGLKVQDWIN